MYAVRELSSMRFRRAEIIGRAYKTKLKNLKHLK